MIEVLVICCAVVVAVGVAFGLQHARRFPLVRGGGDLAALRLRFPADLTKEQVTGVARLLVGLAAGVTTTFEIVADACGISHYVTGRRPQLANLRTHIQAVAPGIMIDDAAPVSLDAGETVAAITKRGIGTLRAEPMAATSVALLAAFQPLRADERMILQWSVASASPTRPNIEYGGKATAEDRVDPAVIAVGRLAVRASGPNRRGALASRPIAVLRSVRTHSVGLVVRSRLQAMLRYRMNRRSVGALDNPARFTPEELVAVIGWPVGGHPLRGINYLRTRPLMPPPEVPSHGRVLGRANFPGHERPIAVTPADSTRHIHLIGPTGSGKSTLMLNLITSDIRRGAGVVVIDPKGDLVADVADRIPDERVSDVIILDPSDDERPVGLNLLAGADDAPDLVVEQVVGLFHNLFEAFWGPRTDDIMRAAISTLVREPNMTLCEVPLLLTNAGFRRRLTAAIDDPIALEPFWAWYEAMKPEARAQAIGPVMNKLRALLLRRQVRQVLGQAKATFSLEQAIAERRILLVSLAKGRLGDEAARLLGALVLSRLWDAVRTRAAVPSGQRHPFYAFLDEFQEYLALPISIADVMATARSYGFSLTLAHQHLGQLPAPVRAAVLANARTKVVFQTSASDGRVLAREFGPRVTADDLTGLGPYEAIAQVAVGGGGSAPPTVIQTAPPPDSLGSAEIVRELSRGRFGVDAAEIDQAIRQRHRADDAAGPVGRRTVR